MSTLNGGKWTTIRRKCTNRRKTLTNAQLTKRCDVSKSTLNGGILLNGGNQSRRPAKGNIFIFFQVDTKRWNFLLFKKKLNERNSTPRALGWLWVDAICRIIRPSADDNKKKIQNFGAQKKNWKFESAILVRRPSEASSRNNWCVSNGIMGSSCDFQGFPPPPPPLVAAVVLVSGSGYLPLPVLGRRPSLVALSLCAHLPE